MSLTSRALSALVQRIKHDPSYVVDEAFTGRELVAEVARRGVSLLRAQVVLLGVDGGRLRFVEEGVHVRHRHRLRVGRGSVIEAGTRLHCLSRDGFHIGDRVTVGKFCILESSGVLWNRGVGLRIGDDSALGDYTFIGASGGVLIGKRVLMGQRISIHSQNHNFADTDRPIQQQGVSQKGVVIGDDCWIGSGSIILDGVELGAGCVVAAGSVVSRSFAAGSVVAGVPARLVRDRQVDD